MKPTEREQTRTRPWLPEELLYVDGKPCVYTAVFSREEGPSVREVHLHGGRTVPLAGLISDCRRVIMPRVVRLDP